MNRVKPKAGNNWPNQMGAGAYSATLHYLRTVAAMGGLAAAKASGRDTVARMKMILTDNDCFAPGVVRADGRKMHPAYPFQVKKPAESKDPFDYYNLIGTAPPEEAFRPMAEGGCPLV
jgi:branched-chain amino acid transport system substrate-binding protein